MGHYNCQCAPYCVIYNREISIVYGIDQNYWTTKKNHLMSRFRASYGVLLVNVKFGGGFTTIIVGVRAVVLYMTLTYRESTWMTQI